MLEDLSIFMCIDASALLILFMADSWVLTFLIYSYAEILLLLSCRIEIAMPKTPMPLWVIS